MLVSFPFPKEIKMSIISTEMIKICFFELIFYFLRYFFLCCRLFLYFLGMFFSFAFVQDFVLLYVCLFSSSYAGTSDTFPSLNGPATSWKIMWVEIGEWSETVSSFHLGFMYRIFSHQLCYFLWLLNSIFVEVFGLFLHYLKSELIAHGEQREK